MDAHSDHDGQDLWAITCYFNPACYRHRLTNYRIFRKHLALPLVAVELAFGAAFDLRPDDAEVLVQLRGGDVMWQKERLLNIALAALPDECRKVVWIDCDTIFQGEDWPERLRQVLDKFPIAQPYSRVAYLGRDAELKEDQVLESIEFWRSSAAFMIATGQPVSASLTDREAIEQTCVRGMVWAARRELLDRHGLYDACIVGNGDLAMTCAAYGCFDIVVQHQQMNERQRAHYRAWAEPFHQAVRAAVGHVEGSLLHLWHGTISNRRYRQRLLDVRQFQFDPGRDIVIGKNGAWRWNSDKRLLHQYLKDYFAARKEDG